MIIKIRIYSTTLVIYYLTLRNALGYPHFLIMDESMSIKDTQSLSNNLQSDIIELDVSRHHLRQMVEVRDDIVNQIWTTFEG